MKIHRKPYRVKKKKSILRNRFFWLGILILIIFSGVFYLTFFHSFFQIKIIEISGNEKVSTESLENLLNEKINQKILFFPSQSIFLPNFGEIKKEILKSFPQIRETHLKRRFPDALLLQIKERKPIAVFCQADNFFFIDKEGIVFESLDSDTKRQDLITLKKQADEETNLKDKVVMEEQLSKILKAESRLKNELKILTEEMLVVSETRFDAKTLEGFQIYFNFQEDLDWQLAKLKAVLEEEIPPEKRKDLEYIDVRFGKFAIPVLVNQ